MQDLHSLLNLAFLMGGGRKGGKEGGRGKEGEGGRKGEGGRVTLLNQQLLICTRKQWEEVLINIARTVISCSHQIWVAHNCKDL